MTRRASSLLHPVERALRLDEYLAVQEAVFRLYVSKHHLPSVYRKWSLYYRVLWETGLRASEALAIRARDIETNYIKVRRLKRKGHPEDRVRIQPQLELALREYIKVEKLKPASKLFPNSIQGAKWVFDKVKAEAKIRDWLTLHSFRHGYAINLLRQPPPGATATEVLTMVQRALGHASISSTTVYVSASKKEVDDWLGKVKFSDETWKA